MRFYLGTHQQGWLRTATIPLFVSRRRLEKLKRLPRAVTRWALDSGGFSELSMYGEWITSEAEYVDKVSRYRDEIGMLDWAAPQDWMCEPSMIDKTNLSVREHQERTVENYLRLSQTGLPFIPVLQGYAIDDYLSCIDLYAECGVHLESSAIVGIGSICRRQATEEIHQLLKEVELAGIRMHGFGVKQSGLSMYSHLLASADSMAWSFNARQQWYHNGITYPGCRHNGCQNCIKWATRWYNTIVFPAPS